MWFGQIGIILFLLSLLMPATTSAFRKECESNRIPKWVLRLEKQECDDREDILCCTEYEFAPDGEEIIRGPICHLNHFCEGLYACRDACDSAAREPKMCGWENVTLRDGSGLVPMWVCEGGNLREGVSMMDVERCAENCRPFEAVNGNTYFMSDYPIR